MSSTILIFHWKRGQHLPNTSILMPLCAKENDFQKMLYKFAEICQFQKKDVLYRFLQVQQSRPSSKGTRIFIFESPNSFSKNEAPPVAPKFDVINMFFLLFFFFIPILCFSNVYAFVSTSFLERYSLLLPLFQ